MQKYALPITCGKKSKSTVLKVYMFSDVCILFLFNHHYKTHHDNNAKVLLKLRTLHIPNYKWANEFNFAYKN